MERPRVQGLSVLRGTSPHRYSRKVAFWLKTLGSSAGISEPPSPGAMGKTALEATLWLWCSQADTCLCPGWEQTFRPILRPHRAVPAPLLSPQGRVAAPKKAKGRGTPVLESEGPGGLCVGTCLPSLLFIHPPTPSFASQNLPASALRWQQPPVPPRDVMWIR